MNLPTRHTTAALFLSALILFSGCSAGAASQNSSIPIESVPNTITCIDFLYPLGNASESGFYYLDYAAKGDYNIKYIDISSKQNVYLCSRPECTHDNESCTAWLKYCENTAGAIPLEDQLLVVYNGSFLQSSYEAYGEQALPSISTATLNGAAMKKIAAFAPQEVFNGKYAVDKNFFYVVTAETVRRGEEVEHYSVVSTVNLETGEIKQSKRFDVPNLQIEGTVQDKLILSNSSLNEADSLSEFQSDIFTFNPSTEAEHFICTIDPVKTAYKIANGKLYTVAYENGELSVLDLQTDSKETIGCIFPDGFSGEVFLKGIVQDGVLFDLRTQGQPDQPCFFGFSEKKVKNINLPLLKNETLDPNRTIEVVAEYSNQYLVISGMTMDSVTFTSSDGASTALPLPRMQFALIGKANYQNSVPTYEFITNA